MSYQNPTVADFKSYFFRDFPFQPADIDPDINLYVQDQDIGSAMVNTNANINQAFFSAQASYSVGYNLLSAHYMVLSLRNASQGINGQYDWLTTSKGVGGVNSSFAIPQRILDNPYWSMLTKTNYGAAYLEMLLPQLQGAMFGVIGPGVILRGGTMGSGVWGWG